MVVAGRLLPLAHQRVVARKHAANRGRDIQMKNPPLSMLSAEGAFNTICTPWWRPTFPADSACLDGMGDRQQRRSRSRSGPAN